MKLGKDKCQLLINERKYKSIWEKIGETNIRETNKQKPLRVQIDEICL